MSDDDLNAIDDGGFDDSDPLEGGTVSGKGSGFLTEKVQKILAYAVVILIVVILSTTISVITYRIMDKGSRRNSFADESIDYAVTPQPYAYFTLIDQIRTKTADKPAQSLIVTVHLGYDEGDEEVYNELVKRTSFLTDQIRNYFSTKTAAQMTPDKENMVKDELKMRINDYLSGSSGIKDVIFPEFQIIEM